MLLFPSNTASDDRTPDQPANDIAVDTKIFPPQGVTEFQASTLFLRDCWDYLTSDPDRNERLHLVTGPITKHGVRILSRMEQVLLEDQCPAHVMADKIDCHSRIVSLDEEHGHKVLGMFHPHLWSGAGSTFPSLTDRCNQDRFEDMWYRAVGGIFSLDGYVRFFTNALRFDIDIYGSRVELISDEPFMKVFHLKDLAK